jgi:hypothetical protein
MFLSPQQNQLITSMVKNDGHQYRSKSALNNQQVMFNLEE